jgi:hypothetical protein
LQCPSSREPLADREIGNAVHVTQIGVADCSFFVPAEHGVDSLGKLSTRRLVYAATVNPGVFEAFVPGQLAATEYLLAAFQASIATVYQVVERDLLVLPSVGQYRVSRNIGSHVLFKLQCSNVQEPHALGTELGFSDAQKHVRFVLSGALVTGSRCNKI